MADDLVEALQDLVGVFGQQPFGMLVDNLQGTLILPRLHQGIGKSRDGREIVVDRQQFVGDRSSFRELTCQQIGFQKIAQTIRIGINVGDLLQCSDGTRAIAGFKHVLSLHQQGISVARIERQHALQDFFGAAERSLGPHALGGGGENLPGFRLLAETHINFRQLDPHLAVFWIHFQNLLEDSDRIVEFAGFEEFFRDLQVLRAGVVEQALLGVEFGQLQQALERRLELADLLVHRDGLDRETLAGIGIAHSFETLRGLVALAVAGVEVTNGVVDRQVFGVVLENLLVLGDGILKLALLDVLLRTGENLLLIEAEQCHKSVELQTLVFRSRIQYQEFKTILRQNPLNAGGCSRVRVTDVHLTYRRMTDRTRPIVRLEVMNRMVTKGYRKGVYRRLPKDSSDEASRVS